MIDCYFIRYNPMKLEAFCISKDQLGDLITKSLRDHRIKYIID